MSKYIGPKLRIIRRLGFLPGLTHKSTKNRLRTPGQHGKTSFEKLKRPSLSDDFCEKLLEKQKLRFNYGITEKQLILYFKKAKSKQGATGINLLQNLEKRLDCIVYRLGFALSISNARQLINHKHILVNKKIVNIPSFICKINDTITIKNSFNSKNLILKNFEKCRERLDILLDRLNNLNLSTSKLNYLFPKHLSFNKNSFEGKLIANIDRSDVLLSIDELKIIEFYSR